MVDAQGLGRYLVFRSERYYPGGAECDFICRTDDPLEDGRVVLPPRWGAWYDVYDIETGTWMCEPWMQGEDVDF